MQMCVAHLPNGFQTCIHLLNFKRCTFSFWFKFTFQWDQFELSDTGITGTQKWVVDKMDSDQCEMWMEHWKRMFFICDLFTTEIFVMCLKYTFEMLGR